MSQWWLLYDRLVVTTVDADVAFTTVDAIWFWIGLCNDFVDSVCSWWW